MKLPLILSRNYYPAFLISCGLVYLPYVVYSLSQLVGEYFKVPTGLMGLMMIIAMSFCLVNWVAGPILILKTSGVKRLLVSIAFIAGAVFPAGIGIIALVTQAS